MFKQIKLWLSQERKRRQAAIDRTIRMRALLDTERDCRRLGIDPSEHMKAEGRELFGDVG